VRSVLRDANRLIRIDLEAKNHKYRGLKAESDLADHIRSISHHGGAILKIAVWIVLGTLALIEPLSAKPRVGALSVTGDVLRIQGAKLGSQCATCEVIAGFEGIRYSLTVNSWTDTGITARLVDVGRGTGPKIEIVTPNWRSEPVRVEVRQQLLPQHRVNRMVRDKSNRDLVYYSRRYDSSMGGKGEEVFDVGEALPACGKVAPIFDSAEVVVGKRTRFGEVKVVQMPGTGCEKCEIGIRYYWEPTGRLEYQLHVYRRIVEGICKARVR